MNQTITSVQGIYCEGIQIGLKNTGRDLAVIYSETPALISAVYTRNKVIAEPLQLSQKHLQNKEAQAIVVNSGYANACTGKKGREVAEQMAKTTSETLKIKKEDVIVSSTGVIGQVPPIDTLTEGIRSCAGSLHNTENAGLNAAEAILTTDTMLKQSIRHIQLNDKTITLSGMAKGSGMIHPDMGTMLAFIFSDISIEEETLDQIFKQAVEQSFNMITIDGDTSTNDMAVIMCNGQAQNKPIESSQDERYIVFQQALEEICISLAKQIVADGEGVSKFIEYKVINASSEKQAKQMIRTISDSSLVKTAMFGEDPNWGRIIAAAGRASVDFNPEEADLYIGQYPLMKQGQAVNDYIEEVQQLLKQQQLYITLDLNQGKESATGWGPDLTIDYVKFNAEYTT